MKKVVGLFLGLVAVPAAFAGISSPAPAVVCENSKLGSAAQVDRMVHMAANELILAEKSLQAASGTLHLSVRYWADTCAEVHTNRGVPFVNEKTRALHGSIYTRIGFVPKSGQAADAAIATDVAYKVDPQLLLDLSGHTMMLKIGDRFETVRRVPSSGVGDISLVGLVDLNDDLLVDGLKRKIENGRVQLGVKNSPDAATQEFLRNFIKGPANAKAMEQSVLGRGVGSHFALSSGVGMSYLKRDVLSAFKGAVIWTAVPGLEKIQLDF